MKKREPVRSAPGNTEQLIAYAKRVANCAHIAAPAEAAADISRTILMLIDALEATERALRIRIWNTCRALGMSDEKSIAAVKLEIDRVFASAMSAEAPEGDVNA